MSSNSIKNYLNYVKDVLGIKHLFLTSKILEVKKLLIAVTDLDTYSAEENKLLQKMVAALKLEPADTVIIDIKNLNQHSALYFLKLVDELNNDQSSSSDTVCTFSPRALLKNAQHKKKAWADMQGFLSLFK